MNYKNGLPYTQYIVVTYRVSFDLRNYIISFIATDGNTYQIDFKNDANKHICNSKDESVRFNTISRYFAIKRQEILEKGYLFIHNYGAEIVD